MDRHRQVALGPLLTHHILIKQGLDLHGLEHLGKSLVTALHLLQILADDLVAKIYALITDIDGGSGDQLLDLTLQLTAKGTGDFALVTSLLNHGQTSSLELVRSSSTLSIRP